MTEKRTQLLMLLAGSAFLLYWYRRQTGKSVYVPPEFSLPDFSLPDFGSTFNVISDGVNAVTTAVGIRPKWKPVQADKYLPMIHAAEDANGIPRDLLTRLIFAESAFRADIISGQTRSRTGAIGIAQILPSTAGNPGYGVAPVNPLDVADSIRFAGQYLAAMRARLPNWEQATAAYNQGLGKIKNKPREQWPLEGRNYSAGIMSAFPNLT